MRGIVRGDHHRVHIGIGDQHESVIGRAGSGKPTGNPLRSREIDVGDQADRGPGDLAVQGLDVIGAHDPGTDHAHANVHLILRLI